MFAVWRALRLNYTRRGAWIWLRARHPMGDFGWQRALRDRGGVIAEQRRIAMGEPEGTTP